MEGAKTRERERETKTEKARVLRNQERGRTGARVGGDYGCCKIIAYSLNIKAWQSASSYSVDGGRRRGIARRAYLYTTSHVRTYMHARIRMHARERKEENNATKGRQERQRRRLEEV